MQEKNNTKNSAKNQWKKTTTKTFKLVAKVCFYRLQCPFIRGKNVGPNIMLSGWKSAWRLAVIGWSAAGGGAELRAVAWNHRPEIHAGPAGLVC